MAGRHCRDKAISPSAPNSCGPSNKKGLSADWRRNCWSTTTRSFSIPGTTCSEMVPHLKKMQGVTVLANSARLVLQLNAPGLSVFLIGGEYRPDRMDTVGPMAASSLNHLRGYVAFFGADGLSMDFGPSASDAASADLNRLVIENSSRGGVVGRQQQISGRPSLFQIADWGGSPRSSPIASRMSRGSSFSSNAIFKFFTPNNQTTSNAKWTCAADRVVRPRENAMRQRPRRHVERRFLPCPNKSSSTRRDRRKVPSVSRRSQ